MPGDEAIHTLHIRATDNAGNDSGQLDYGPYNLDLTAPTIALTNAPPANTCSLPQAITWTVTDGACGLAHVWYAWDNTANYAESTTYAVTIPDGTHTLYLKAQDSAGNTTADMAFGPFTADATPPAAPRNVVVVADNNYGSVRWQAPVETGCATVTGYNVYQRSAGGSYVKLTAVPTSGLSYSERGLTNGSAYDYKVAAVDSLGREGTAAEVLGTIIGKRGDLNGDGVLDVSDVVILINIVDNPGSATAAQMKLGDYNSDGQVNAADVAALKNAVLGK